MEDQSVGKISQSGEADIAAAVSYLAADEPGYVTGHALVVHGGWRAR